jgi:ABC-type uncharacterized transport system fused permease/ATPase subunit
MLKAILNYIRGSEEFKPNSEADPVNQTHQRPRKSLLEKINHALRLNLRYANMILGVMFPKFCSVSTLIFIVLLALMIGTEFVVYQVGLLSGKFLEVLSEKNLGGFMNVAVLAIWLIVVNAWMKAARDYLANLLSIVWRKFITLRIHDMYFHKKQFYYLHNPMVFLANLRARKVSQLETRLEVGEENNTPIALSNRRSDLNRNMSVNSSTAAILGQQVGSTSLSENENASFDDVTFVNLDNPDQRITQDVNSLCQSLSTIVPAVLMTPFLIGWYGYKVNSSECLI